MCLSSCVSSYLPIYLSVYLSLCLSVCLSTCLSASLKTKLFCETSSFFRSWLHKKGSNSARLLHFLNLTTSKTKQFCETSSIFELDNIKNKAILRDFLQKWKVECSADGLAPMRFAIFPLHLSKAAPATKNKCQIIRSAAPVTQNHLRKSTYLMLQNATPLRKSAPWPPNISDEHVSCTAPARRMHLCRSSSNFPRLPSFLEMLQELSRFAHFWHGAQSLAPATRNEIWTSKSGPKP